MGSILEYVICQNCNAKLRSRLTRPFESRNFGRNLLVYASRNLPLVYAAIIHPHDAVCIYKSSCFNSIRVSLKFL